VELIELRKTSRWDLIGPFVTLVRHLRASACDVVYSFLPVANLFAGAAVLITPRTRIVWGIRTAGRSNDRAELLARVLAAMEWLCMTWPALVITNSMSSLEQLRERGLSDRKAVLIDNGVDSASFRFDARARSVVRAEWGVRADEYLIGAVGRINSEKRLAILLQAANVLVSRGKTLRVVLVGTGGADDMSVLRCQATELGLADTLIWAGVRNDMASVYSALDVLCLTSRYEGSPNILAEAMMCGLICIASDVGDVRRILQSHGKVVRPGDCECLARALEAASKDQAGESRQSVVNSALEMFDMEKMVSNTERMLKFVVDRSESSHHHPQANCTDD